MAKNEVPVYCGTSPWANISTPVENLLKSEDVIKAAGLDWEAGVHPLTAQMPDNSLVKAEDKNITYRKDTNQILGVVGGQYTIVNNKPAFKIADDIMALSDGAKFDSAGSIDKSRKVWLLARLPHDITIPNTTDVVRSYLMIQNAHDGTGSLSAGFIPMLVRTKSVMNAAIPGMNNSVAIRHTKFVENHIQEASRVLKMAKNYFDNLQQLFTHLATGKITREQVENIVNKIVPIGEDAVRKTRSENAREKIMNLYDTSNIPVMFPQVKGTGWHAYNAFVEYLDHWKTYRNTKKSTIAVYENRFQSILGGNCADIKNTALNMILEAMESNETP